MGQIWRIYVPTFLRHESNTISIRNLTFNDAPFSKRRTTHESRLIDSSIVRQPHIMKFIQFCKGSSSIKD